MINSIRGAFIGMLNESTWMDAGSKSKAIEKVRMREEDGSLENFIAALQAQFIDQKIGYPDYLGSDNNTQLEKYYQEVRNHASYSPLRC